VTEERPRSREERKRDVLARFEQDIDAWVSTASAAADPYLVPLSFLWHEGELLFSTEERSQTIRNLRDSPRVHVGLGLTRDVVLVSGVARLVPSSELPRELGDAFAVKAGFDPRTSDGTYVYVFVRPIRIRAWREVDELAGQVVMKDGNWVV
jgi:general stress protein 26